MNRMFRSFSLQRGTTMIEVLVSIVVFSFGMLGMLGMVVSSLKMTSTSGYRSFAAEQLAAMAEALNANPDLIANFNYTSSQTPTANCLTATGCTTTQLPKTEYELWRRRLGAVLPNGNGVICLDSTPADGDLSNWSCSGSGRPTVKVCWDETRVAHVAATASTAEKAWNTGCLSTQL